MKYINLLLHKSLNVILAVCLISFFCGCQPAIEKQVYEPVLFPPLPDQPRLQFLKSFSGPKDIGAKGPSSLELFLLGEAEESNALSKPYGLAIHKGKIYVCDTQLRQVKILDLINKTFSEFPLDKRQKIPINIFIEPNGTKYIADSLGGSVFIYNENNKLVNILGRGMGITPVDVDVRGEDLYLTDSSGSQVVVLDKRSGKLQRKIGRKVSSYDEIDMDEFAMISNTTMDKEGNIYITDKIKANVTKFDSSGQALRTYSRLGSLAYELARPKGIALDRENRLWVVDAGPSMTVKIFREDGQFLMFFGTPGTGPGKMYMPMSIIIDYDHIDLFKQYAVEGAELEFLVLVTNQYGPNKVSVYGYGAFPDVGSKSEAAIGRPSEIDIENETSELVDVEKSESDSNDH